MRDIKFRAWNIIEEEMKEWEPSYFGDIVFGLSGDEWIPMQFTWLHDKNGKEIYEGDLMLFDGSDKPHPIAYDETYGGWCPWVHNIDDYDRIDMHNWIIVWNIYENS